MHHIIAAGQYVWAHLTFFNLLDYNPEDTGIVGIDIFRMDAEGRAVEYWEALQVVGTAPRQRGAMACARTAPGQRQRHRLARCTAQERVTVQQVGAVHGTDHRTLVVRADTARATSCKGHPPRWVLA